MPPTGERMATMPVSFAQERLWFLDRLDPGRPTYNIPLAIHLGGSVTVEDVEGALLDLAVRHEALRTTFQAIGGEPAQVIAAHPDVRLDVVDLRNLPEAERSPAALRRAQDMARAPFDLAEGPLLRAALLRLSGQEHVLVLTVHHIVADLWSSAVLFRDFNALYEARRRGGHHGLPHLPIQYADFAAWQRQTLRGARLQQLVDYWSRRLDGAPAEVTFPLDHPRPPTQSYRGETLRFTVPPEVRDALARLARDEGATLFMALLAGFKVVLGRFAGSDDVVVGTPIANRTRAEVEGLIGFFSNTLVLRTDLGGDPTFRELVRRVKDTTLGAYDHQDLPFERLVAELGTERTLNVPQLFQVLFGLQTTQDSARSPAGPTTAWGEISTATAKFDVTVLVNETTDGLDGGFEYCTDLWDRATIEQVIRYLVACLGAVAAAPDRPLSEVVAGALTGAHGRVEPLPVRAGAGRLPGTPVEWFAAQARQTPEAPAVVTGDEAVSFRQLDVLSDRIGGRLRAAGVGHGARVGLCLSGGVDAPAAVLGTLKAGAAYVPLDPSYPPGRLALMVEDAGLAAVVVDEATSALVADEAPVRVTLDPAWRAAPEPGDEPTDGAPGPLVPQPQAGDPAYVIYTSGSTGTPKGVVVTHGTLANLIAWQVDSSPAALRTLQVAPLSFDVSFQELFSTWAAGGVVVTCPATLRADPAALLAWARRHRVERLFLPPALLVLAADVAGPSDWPETLREVVTAGEALRITPSVRDVLGGVVLRNQYGPSETHVVTEWAAPASGPDVPDLPDLPPIGRPLPGVEAWVLDASMAPVPVGARGELYIGGAAATGGYLGRPGATAERFVPDPVSGAAGARLYRTGDLVRLRPDGELQFLGRADDQLKVRGYRVEPGEVEAELGRLDGVRAAAALGVGDPTRLVAYVEPEAAGTVDPGGLRRLLRDRLPAWLVPDHITVVDRLPLTPSGKVDRRSLGARELAAEDAPARVAARSALEAALCGLWCEVLELDDVGVRESFFDLGGHSIALARVAARVRDRMGVDLPLRVFFEATTIDDLAREVVVRRALAEGLDTIEALLCEGPSETEPSPVERAKG